MTAETLTEGAKSEFVLHLDPSNELTRSYFCRFQVLRSTANDIELTAVAAAAAAVMAASSAAVAKLPRTA